jgi:hypothetical protein
LAAFVAFSIVRQPFSLPLDSFNDPCVKDIELQDGAFCHPVITGPNYFLAGMRWRIWRKKRSMDGGWLLLQVTKKGENV